MSSQILVYFSSTSVGESEKTLIEGLSQISTASKYFCILVPNEKGDLPALLADKKIAYECLEFPEILKTRPTRKMLFLWVKELYLYQKKLGRYCAMYDFSLVHTSGFMAHLFSIFLKIRFGVPLLWQLWEIPPKGVAFFFFQRLLSIFCDRFLVCSREIIELLGRSLLWKEKVCEFNQYSASSDLIKIYKTYFEIEIKVDAESKRTENLKKSA